MQTFFNIKNPVITTALVASDSNRAFNPCNTLWVWLLVHTFHGVQDIGQGRDGFLKVRGDSIPRFPSKWLQSQTSLSGYE